MPEPELKRTSKKVTYRVGFNLDTPADPWYAMEKEDGSYFFREFEAKTKDALIEKMKAKGISISIDFDIGDEGIRERHKYSKEIDTEKYVLEVEKEETPPEETEIKRRVKRRAVRKKISISQ